MSVFRSYHNAVLSMHIAQIRQYAEQLDRLHNGTACDEDLIAQLTTCLLDEASSLSEQLSALAQEVTGDR